MGEAPVEQARPSSGDPKEGVKTHGEVTILGVRLELHKEKTRGDLTGAFG